MAALTPSFLFNLEKKMKHISASEYERLTRNLWWNQVAKTMPSSSKAERLTWLLDTAKIERPNASRGGGQAIFEDILSATTEFEAENATAGLELKKEQLEDLDGNGVHLASHWARSMGAYAAYWPQKVVAEAIRSNPNTYDGQAFFSGAHPINPFKSSFGTFSNNMTAGSGAGAVPVSNVTLDTALENLQKVIAYTASIKMPNGEDPRMLKVSGILHPPALTARMQQLTSAQFLAQAASGGGGGSGDVRAVIANQGLGTPIEAPELGAGFGGSDTAYYLLMEEITSNDLGAFVYVDREPFKINMHGPMTDAELARARKFQWLTNGRNVVGAGHPYLMIKCNAT